MKHLNICKKLIIFSLLIYCAICFKESIARPNYLLSHQQTWVNGVYASGNEVWAATRGGLMYNNGVDLTTNWSNVNRGITFSCFIKSQNGNWIAGSSVESFGGGGSYGGIRYSLAPILINPSWIESPTAVGLSVTCLALIGTNTVLAGTETGLYQSLNEGQTWSAVLSAPYNIKSILVVGTFPIPTIYIGTPNGVFNSVDNGLNWNPYGLSGESITSLSKNAASTVIYAGAEGFGAFRANFYSRVISVGSWLDFDPNQDTWNYGTTTILRNNVGSKVAVANTSSEVAFTSDNGLNYFYEAGTMNYEVSCLAQSSNKIFAGTHGGFYYSSGNNWNNPFTWNGVPWNHVPVGQIWILPIAVASVRDGVGFVASTDQGITWAQHNTGLDSETVINLNYNNNNFLVSTRSGVYRSSNLGASWQQTSLTDSSIVNFTSNGFNVYAVSRNTGFYRSSNAGLSWTSSNTGLNNLQLRDVTMHGGQLFVCGKGGIYRSSNTGLSWVSSGGDSSSYSLASDNSMLYCAGSKLFFSSNTGGSWGSNLLRSPSNFLESNDVVNKLAAKNGKVYLASTSADSGLFISSNYGATWSNSYEGWGSRRFTSITLDSASIYLGDYNGCISKLAINSTNTLNFRCMIEGLYPGTGESMIPDSVTVNLRSTTPPYSIVESSKLLLSATGTGTLNFSNVSNGVSYYIQINNRNSIETWSKSGGEVFTGGALNYDFTTSASKAYGNNLVMKGTKYCIYSGDVNQDGWIDLSDVVQIGNDATNFISGAVTDLDGSGATDLTDLLIAYNNAANFVAKIKP